MQVRALPLPWTTVTVASETAVFIPCTAYLDANGVVMVRPTLEIAAEFGNMEVSAAYQTADVENAGDTALAFGGYKDDTGVFYPTDNYDIGVNTKSAQLVRFGLLAKNKSGQGTSVSSMRVGGKIEIS
jgi:hypothetical protein